MSTSFPQSPFMPCPECGASVAADAQAGHVCDPERRVDFAVFQLREDLSGLDAEIEKFLASSQGRFEQWWAERERRRADEPADESPDPPVDGS